VREDVKRSLFPSAQALTTSSITYAQGDLLMLDVSAHTIRKVTSGDLGAWFLGISEVNISSGKLVQPYTTDVASSVAISDIPGPVIGVVAKLVLKTSDSINPGDPVYLNVSAGAFHVTVTQAMGAIAIGYYQGAALSSVAAGTLVEIKLVCNNATVPIMA
jgi:hypothetical protein